MDQQLAAVTQLLRQTSFGRQADLIV